MKFSAILHGADPKELENRSPSKQKKEIEDNLLFGDPADYAKWSPEKREEVTKKMMAKFTTWAGVK